MNKHDGHTFLHLDSRAVFFTCHEIFDIYQTILILNIGEILKKGEALFMEENFAKDFFVVQFFKNYINTQMSYTLKVLTKG